MSIDFATLQGLSIPEGNVIEIKDAAGRVIWAVKSADSGKVILEVEKITSDTYAGETTYTAEEFILLSIYPKTNGTVTVTYGGLSKTITDTSGAAEPNAQQVYFGTLYGVSDSVETPVSGELTIEGNYRCFAVGIYNTPGEYKTGIDYCGCVTAVTEWGSVSSIPSYAFHSCTGLTRVIIPSRITSVGMYAFHSCTGLTRVSVLATTPPVAEPDATGAIGDPFEDCDALAAIVVPAGCGEAYKTAEGWNIQADLIVEAS